MKKSLLIVLVLFVAVCSFGQSSKPEYLSEIQKVLVAEWPKNRTINLVFHGHSVPSGYFKTPTVNTLGAYPQQVLKLLKEKYPLAVINIIVTAIGGEHAVNGEKRFDGDVLIHKPDVLFIDYSLNDLGIGLENAKAAWEKMIEKAQKQGIKVILLTPSPDQRMSLSDPNTDLQKHSDQVKALAKKYNTGLIDSYAVFQQINEECKCIPDYMSQVNHPNEKGHELIAKEIVKYFGL